jgi:hypothetical protein
MQESGAPCVAPGRPVFSAAVMTRHRALNIWHMKEGCSTTFHTRSSHLAHYCTVASSTESTAQLYQEPGSNRFTLYDRCENEKVRRGRKPSREGQAILPYCFELMGLGISADRGELWTGETCEKRYIEGRRPSIWTEDRRYIEEVAKMPAMPLQLML